MKLFKIIATLIVVIGLLVVGILGYAGIIPGVSAIFGANEPRDLESPHSAVDLVSGQAKLQQTFVSVSSSMTAKTILNTGTSNVDITLTAAEWAAHLEAVHPVKDLQIKFLPGGSFEAAGRVDKDRVFDTVRLLGFTNLKEVDVLNKLERYLPGNAVFYLKGSGEIVDDKPVMTLERFELGRLPFGRGAMADALVAYAKLFTEKVPGLAINQMNIDGGNLAIDGAVIKQIPRF